MKLTFAQRTVELGRFVIVKRGGQWEEMMLASKMPDAEWIIYTQDDVGNFKYSFVKLVLGQYKGQQGGTAARQAALGVDEGSINWICAPPDLDVRWALMAARKREILAEDAEIAELVNTEQRQ